MVEELSYEQVRRACPEVTFECDSSAELSPLDEIVGQDRAMRALNFGLRMGGKGFNVFVTGQPGTGRRTTILESLKELAATRPVPPDLVYVQNFQDNSRPNALTLPAGMGRKLKDAMEKFANSIQPALREAFESQDYAKRREATMQKINRERDEIVHSINTMAQAAGFIVQPSQIGLALTPVNEEGKPLTDQEIAQLPPALQKKIQQDREALNSKIGDAFRPMQELVRKVDSELQAMNRQVAAYAIAPYLEGIKSMFKPNDEVQSYLKDVENDILENVLLFMVAAQKEAGAPGQVPVDPIRDYHVNLVVDNSNLKGAPTVLENNPTYPRLFGATEKEARFGTLVTDYTLVRPGAAHRANGGFLVIPVERMFQDPLVWEGLKQTISNGALETEDFASRMGYIITKTLRPEPVVFDAKIVLLGNPQTYGILYNMDPDFRELFKVKADFDTVMPREDKNVERYARFICGLCNKEGLLHLDSSALAAIVEYSSRMADDQEKLSTQFSLIADIIREANFYTVEEGAKFIGRKHINKQLEEKTYRSNLIQQKIEELIAEGTVLLDIAGKKVGQANGLAVLSTGDFAFGRPSRITASVGVGHEGVIDIERMAQMGGPTHTKGIGILTGFLNERYATNAPLSLSARLVFEQSYSGVDGDSASSTELYALLSELSGLPIRQDLAITGSVNQKGEVQAIGGVNEKVEGYFEVCKRLGITGTQGCMVPASNVKNLMLKDEVVEAIKAGKFHIYPIGTIDQGIEMLTGVKAGKRRKDGTYDKGSVNDLVQKRLEDMAGKVKEFHP